MPAAYMTGGQNSGKGGRKPAAPEPFVSPLQDPGNNLTNPDYSEQTVQAVQDRLLNDPTADQMNHQYDETQAPSAGEANINNNLNDLEGPGNADQYWEGVQGQFNGPGQGSDYTRSATAGFDPTGPASAFNDQAQGQYDNFTNYQGAGNSQGQYDANAAFGPNSAQQYNDQMQGTFDEMGRYNDPNLAAGQYQQTQGAFGDMPIAQFDPFYDRARQLGVQSYNQDAAGRGVYGSSEALSGVGNVITDIEAQRANRSFDAEMQRTQEQRMRQQLLGEQARAGDLSSVAGHAAGLAGIETYGDLADKAAGRTTDQQTMLGNQANDADDNAQAAQDSNIRGTEVLGDIAHNADTTQTDRYDKSTAAMIAADRADVDRTTAGANIADQADDNERDDYRATTDAGTASANAKDARTRTGIEAADRAHDNDLAGISELGDQAATASDDHRMRQEDAIDAVAQFSRDVAGINGAELTGLFGADQTAFDDYWKKQILPKLQDAQMSQEDQDAKKEALMAGLNIIRAET